jgi:hypothetical protein
MLFVSNGGKFKLYTVPNGLLFSTPPEPRFSFERMILIIVVISLKKVLDSRRRENASCSGVFTVILELKKMILLVPLLIYLFIYLRNLLSH